MDGPLKSTTACRNVVKLLQGRERKLETARLVQRHTQFTDQLVKRLGLEHELEGHQGCVNCLEWSANGKLLASGSDDTDVIIWDPFNHRLLKTLSTPHIGNIFSVKFLGNDGSLIATGAGDCRVIVQSIEQAVLRQTPHLDCVCHIGRVKRLAISPEQPLLFWSASEDGLIIQYDMREPHECLSKCKVFLDLSCTAELKCIAVNPVKPHLIAIGANDCFVRLYDRRMVKISNCKLSHSADPHKRTTSEPQDPRCVQYFAPGHLAKDFGSELNYKLAATYVTFNSSGSDMLVNMGGEQVYLFDINNPRHVNELQVPDTFSEKNNSISKLHGSVKNETMGSVRTKKIFMYNKRIAKQPCGCDYLGRGRTLFQRKWMGDVYSAARDFLYVIKYWPDKKDAYIGLIQCLIHLRWVEEANDWLEYFRKHFPDCANDTDVKSMCTDLTALKEGKENSGERYANEKAFSDEEKQLRLESKDYETRFLGHCNTTTDIKEANFLGEDGNFVCAGSDDGIIFIWDRKTTNVVTALLGDVSIVNCVQPHPTACLMATSGIDPVVKLWSPAKEDGTDNTRVVVDPWAAIKANQQRMAMDPFETMLANMGYRITPLDGQEVPSCRTS